MITEIKNLPSNMIGFKATNEVTEKDFDETVIPKVKELVSNTDTSLDNFTLGAWFKDALMGIKKLTKWNRAAIVTDIKGVKTFTDIFSALMPGEFKAFEHKDQQLAIDWVSGQ
ncbi:MAG: STAS/SEC14 domain-containing protein [Cytophaga sp.]|uniref:STAS/SEC14 domain-containing protein n=1 Tax=Cytophaga sp. TaxID=29535 RepID=UPI003F7D1546